MSKADKIPTVTVWGCGLQHEGKPVTFGGVRHYTLDGSEPCSPDWIKLPVHRHVAEQLEARGDRFGYEAAATIRRALAGLPERSVEGA